MILNSDIIIDFLKNNNETVEKVLKIKETEDLKTTLINAFEVLNGFFALDKKEDNIIQFINNLSVLNFDFNASKIASEIFNELRKNGEIIDALDLFIASIAIANNEKLFTRNNKHFGRISGLELEN